MIRVSLILVLVLWPLVGCGDSRPLSESPEPYDRWIGTWQGIIDDYDSHDWNTDYLYVFKASGDVEVRHRKSSELLLVGIITVTHDEFTLRLRYENNESWTVYGIWTITGDYLHLRYREGQSLLKRYSGR